MKIFTFDTTLRDGTQGESISFSVDDKLVVAQKLDELGIDYIEGGWPGSNPKDKEFFERARELKLKTRQAGCVWLDPVRQEQRGGGPQRAGVGRSRHSGDDDFRQDVGLARGTRTQRFRLTKTSS